MGHRLQKFATFLLVFVGASYSVSTFPQSVDINRRRGDFTAGELALLPPYCEVTQGRPGYEGERGNHWRSLMGDDFRHMHHYCRGLNDIYVSKWPGLSARDRRFVLERAAREFQYIVRNSRPTMVLMPEVYVSLMDVQLKLGNVSAAYGAYERAKQLKPDYWPAYAKWADELVRVKQFGSAKQVLEEGLVQAPGSAELQRRLSEVKQRINDKR